MVREDVPIPEAAWRRRRPADLLKLVALSPGRAVVRERVLESLWPDKDAASAANNLHRALYDLRQVLGGRWVDISRGELRLRPDVWVDVEAFERAVAEGGPARWSEAVALYRGDLSPEDPASPWLAPHRARLRAQLAEAAYPLARAAAEEGDAAGAIPLLRRTLDVDPGREEAHQLLMRVLAESGRRAEALRQSDACEQALRAAGAGPPGPETLALRLAIQRGELGPVRARPALDAARRAARRLLGSPEPAPVRGRGPLLLLLEALVERGSGAVILLGEPGVGKTRLAVAGAALAQQRGAVVLSGAAGAQDVSAPFALFADLFREEARANPEAPDPFGAGALPGGPAEAVRLALFDGVSRALAQLAGGRPLFLLLDDVHEADESSLNLLHHLIRRASALRLMVVATCRDEGIQAGTPIHLALAHLDGSQLARGVRIPRLGLDGTREQIADLLGAVPPEPLVAQVYRATDGCPFLVEEAVREHRESGRPIPSAPASSIRARIARLGPQVEALLGAAAVAGRRFDFELLRTVSPLTAQEAGAALEACLAAGVLGEEGPGYRFLQALVRDAIYQGLPAGRRAALHAAVADALEASAAFEIPAEALARHRLLAGQEDRAWRPLVAAGHRAASRAGLREALDFYAQALALAGHPGVPGGPERLELLEAIGRIQLELGELGEAAHHLRQVARLPATPGIAPTPRQRARAHRLAALACAVSGQVADADAEIEEGLGAGRAYAGVGDEAPALILLRAQLRFHAGRFAEARAAAQAAVELATQVGDGESLARARDLADVSRAMLGEPLSPLDPAGGRLEGSHREPTPEHRIELLAVLWDAAVLGDVPCPDLARAAGLLLARGQERGSGEVAAVGRLGEGVAVLAAGLLDAAELDLRAALNGFQEAGATLGAALAGERLGTTLILFGRFSEANDLLGEALVLAERAPLRRHLLTRIHAAQARLRLAAGLPGSAEDALHQASEAAARHVGCLACDGALRPEAVRVALARGRVAGARTEAEALQAIAGQHGGRGLSALATLAAARVLSAEGQAEAALGALARARGDFLAGGQRYEAARTVRLERRLRGDRSPPGGLAELDALLLVDADA